MQFRKLLLGLSNRNRDLATGSKAVFGEAGRFDISPHDLFIGFDQEPVEAAEEIQIPGGGEFRSGAPLGTGGAAVSAFASTFPWIIPLSRHKNWLFLGAGILLMFNAFMTLQPKGKVACTITGGKGCDVAGSFTKKVFWASIIIYAIGAFAAYALVPLLMILDSDY